MKKIFTFMWSFDYKFWDDNIVTNKYWATICMLLIGLLGAFLGGSTTLQSTLDWNTMLEPVAIYLLTATIWSTLIFESIICTSVPRIALLRSLWLTGATVVVFALSALLAVVVIFIIIAIVALFVLWLGLSMISSSNGSSSKSSWFKLDDGTKVKKTGSGLLGEQYYKSSDGRTFTGHNGSNTVTED